MRLTGMATALHEQSAQLGKMAQDDPALAARLGQAARAKALAEFDERIMIERTLAVYRELLGEAPQAHPRSL